MNQSNHSTPEETFIQHIWEEKALWDTENPYYKDLEAKTKIWRGIADKCNSTGNYHIRCELKQVLKIVFINES